MKTDLASPDLASRFVDVASRPWEKTRYPGVEQKTLHVLVVGQPGVGRHAHQRGEKPGLALHQQRLLLYAGVARLLPRPARHIDEM